MGGAGATGGGVGNDAPSGITSSKKLDVLLMVDNSASMADKQDPLARTIGDLIKGLANADDVHVGVITSSLGGHGATLCEGTDGSDDHAHLIGKLPRGASLNLPKGFVEWTPAAGAAALQSQVQAMVLAAGETGCGLESQLEAVYRFLADPFPPESIALAPCPNSTSVQCAFRQGSDSELLAERAAFLRPDSVLAVVLLTDENDCSIRDAEQYYYAATVDILLPQAATVCDTNPNDPCCHSCGTAAPAACAPDPFCSSAPGIPLHTPQTDPPNLRCFDQKRRFGIDFLYPVARYVNALTAPMLCSTLPELGPVANCPNRFGGLPLPGVVPNPLFTSASGGPVRDPSMVHLLGILGVPWQDLRASTDAQGAPYPANELHYLTPDALITGGVWDKILGDAHPANNAPPILPTDPHMQEAIDARPGLPGPTTPPNTDPINGHEWNVSDRTDLQYACIFPLAQPKACTEPTQCDCYNRPPTDANPLCADSTGNYSNNAQYKAKAYPSLRELSVLKALGPNAVAASICPRNLTDTTAEDFAYRPGVEALAAELQGSVR